MAGKKNLKSNTERTPEELRAMGAKGGKASGEARKRKKQTRALITQLLGMRIKTDVDMKKALKKIGYNEKAEGAPTIELVMNMAIASQAMGGDIASARYLYDYAQVPDMKTKVELEKIKAQAKGAKLDLTVSREDAAIQDEVEAILSQQTQAQTPAPAP